MCVSLFPLLDLMVVSDEERRPGIQINDRSLRLITTEMDKRGEQDYKTPIGVSKRDLFTR